MKTVQLKLVRDVPQLHDQTAIFTVETNHLKVVGKHLTKYLKRCEQLGLIISAEVIDDIETGEQVEIIISVKGNQQLAIHGFRTIAQAVSPFVKQKVHQPQQYDHEKAA